MCLHQCWPKPRGVLIAFDGGGTRTQCLQRKRHVVMRQTGLWIEPQSLGETIGRVLKLALRQMNQPKVVMRIRVIRLKPQRDSEFFSCADEVTVLAKKIGQLDTC